MLQTVQGPAANDFAKHTQNIGLTISMLMRQFASDDIVTMMGLVAIAIAILNIIGKDSNKAVRYLSD